MAGNPCRFIRTRHLVRTAVHGAAARYGAHGNVRWHRGKSRCNTATTLRTGRADAIAWAYAAECLSEPRSETPVAIPRHRPRPPRAPRHPWETCDMPRTAVRSPYQRGGPQSPWLLLAHGHAVFETVFDGGELELKGVHAMARPGVENRGATAHRVRARPLASRGVGNAEL